MMTLKEMVMEVVRLVGSVPSLSAVQGDRERERQEADIQGMLVQYVVHWVMAVRGASVAAAAWEKKRELNLGAHRHGNARVELSKEGSCHSVPSSYRSRLGSRPKR